MKLLTRQNIMFAAVVLTAAIVITQYMKARKRKKDVAPAVTQPPIQQADGIMVK